MNGWYRLRVRIIPTGAWSLSQSPAQAAGDSYPPRLKNSRGPRIAAMRSISSAKSAWDSRKFKRSEFTINKGAAGYWYKTRIASASSRDTIRHILFVRDTAAAVRSRRGYPASLASTRRGPAPASAASDAGNLLIELELIVFEMS